MNKVLKILISVFILIVLGAYFRYETDSEGVFDIRRNRISNTISVRNTIHPKAPWRETKLKSMRQAKAFLYKKQIQKAIDSAVDNVIYDAVEEAVENAHN